MFLLQMFSEHILPFASLNPGWIFCSPPAQQLFYIWVNFESAHSFKCNIWVKFESTHILIKPLESWVESRKKAALCLSQSWVEAFWSWMMSRVGNYFFSPSPGTTLLPGDVQKPRGVGTRNGRGNYGRCRSHWQPTTLLINTILGVDGLVYELIWLWRVANYINHSP